MIVLGKVIEVSIVKGVRFARVNVLKTYKGPELHEIFFLAQPTWVCDTSKAIEGETTLLFLRSYRDTREGLDQMYLSPLVSRKDLAQAGLGTSIFSIVDSGRGRMPVHLIKGQEYATLWVGDVLLPASMHTVPGPDPKYRFIRSVRLTDVIELVSDSNVAPAHIGNRR